VSDVDTHPASIEALAATQEHAAGVRSAVEQLLAHLRSLDTPATPETVALTAALPTKRLEAGIAARSIGIYNPSPSIVYMGYGGGKPTVDSRAWSVPPGSALVLPILAEDLEFGAEAAELAAGDVVFMVLRYKTVQPFFFGAL
jgi:hypothetical protein